MKISLEAHQRKIMLMNSMHTERSQWMTQWRKLSDYYLPKRYIHLQTPGQRKNYLDINTNILDGTGTDAGRILAAGMMSGNTSPSRPWFNLRLPEMYGEVDPEVGIWLDQVEKVIRLIMSESNYYNSLAVVYLDLAFFGTASMLIYESYDDVISCYNCALGEYYFAQNAEQMVDTFGRQFTYTVKQMVEKWGIENCSEQVQSWWKEGGANRNQELTIYHLLEPNVKDDDFMPGGFAYRESYWEAKITDGNILGKKGFFEPPGVFSRWEVTGNDSYGTGPGLDALGDVIQLQEETKVKGQMLHYAARPHMLVDINLQHKATAFLPGGQTFISGLRDGNSGAKPAWDVRPPLQELTMDIRDIQARIRMIFQNDLFQMISQLETVRSATEIDARREEKLIRLGPVLERFNREVLEPSIQRIYGIAQRAGLLPPPPPGLDDVDIEIQYVSVLSSAQNAVGTIAIEQFLQLIGNLSAVYPGALRVPNWETLLVDYGRAIGVPEKGINSKERIAELAAQDQQAQSEQQAIEAAPTAVDAGRLLSETNVGGGQNALSQMLGL